MKKFITLIIVVLFSVIASQSIAQEQGDIGSLECREVQLAVQDAVLSEGPYKNHGQMMRTVTHLVNEEKKAGRITGRCAACIKKQFAQRIPSNEQELCGTDPIAQEVLNFATNTFKKIRNVVAPEDETKPEAEFIGNHVEVKSGKWVYVLDRVGQQIFRPVETCPLLQNLLLPERDITRNLDVWKREPVPADIVQEARRLAMVALGVNYNGDAEVNVYPARELITSKNVKSGITRHYEGRTIVMFSPFIPDEQKVTKYVTETIHDDQGEPSDRRYPIRVPRRSYETAISFADGKVIRIESSAPQPPGNLRIVELLHEGLLNGSILGQLYPHGFLTFGGFFSPDEWAFEYNAHAWEGEIFATDTTTSCPVRPTGLPCHDDYWLIFDQFRDTPIYHQLFLSEWCDLGMYNGVRGNCTDYDPATRSCQSWQYPRVVIHKDLGTYMPLGCAHGDCFTNGLKDKTHCDGVSPQYEFGYRYTMNQQFYDDLEQCHIAMISTHGGQFCFGFYLFKKQYEIWVSLHREGDAGLGNRNLRHLFLQTCDSMGSIHSEKHGSPNIFENQWMNGHIAAGIRTICGLDGPAVGKAGVHVSGLPFFSHYHRGDSIIDSFFSQELEASECNTPVTIAYGATEQEAASTLFDGRFTSQPAGTGHIISAGVLTPHLAEHQACCLPDGRCENLPWSECQNPNFIRDVFFVPQEKDCQVMIPYGCTGRPQGVGTICKTSCGSGNVKCTGACCEDLFDTDVCAEVVSEFDCSFIYYGNFMGLGTSCPTACTEACCMQDGLCSNLPRNDCILGTPQGVGTHCTSVQCP